MTFKAGKLLFSFLWLFALLWISFATFLSIEIFEIMPQYVSEDTESESNSWAVMSWDEYSWCYGNYCWSSRDEFFIKVEEKFIEDLYDDLHKKDYTESNKCKNYHISSIAYWFSAVEHWNWDSPMAKITNNITSLKESRGGYQYMWKKEYWKYNWYVIYPNKFEAILDFMHLYKYWYGCYVWERRVATYKEGKWTDTETENFQRYYRNLLKYINAFENRNFKDK